MDISNLSVSEVACLDLLHPLTGEPIPGANLLMYGSDSAKYREMMIDIGRKRVERKGEPMTADEQAKEEITRLASLIKEIRGLEENGKNIADPVHLLTKYPWVREQADRFVMVRANFLPKA